MGQFSGVILCLLSAYFFHECEDATCYFAAIIVGLICLWTWLSIRSPELFATMAKWQRRLRLTLLNPELYKHQTSHEDGRSLYPDKSRTFSPDWIVAVNLVFTAIGLFLFIRAIHAKFFMV
jgi:hypothetical protein